MKEKIDLIINKVDTLIHGVLRNRNINSIENYKKEFIEYVNEIFTVATEEVKKETTETEKTPKKKSK